MSIMEDTIIRPPSLKDEVDLSIRLTSEELRALMRMTENSAAKFSVSAPRNNMLRKLQKACRAAHETMLHR